MYEIITLGSTTLDVFVKAHEELKKHREHLDVCYPLGEKVLINDIHFATGGGGTNTAVAFSRLGLKAGFIGAIGEDLHGSTVLEDLKKEKVYFLGRKKKGKTGYSIILLGKGDRTILTYKGVNNDLQLSDISLPINSHWLYISTMLGKSRITAGKIAAHAKANKVKIAANISYYEAKLGLKKLSSFLKNIDVLVLNKNEAFLLTNQSNAKNALSCLSKYIRGIIIITDGYHPVNAFYNNNFYVKHIKKIHPVDATGAGDAFASGFLYGIMKGRSIQTALDLGHREALSVLMHIGAKTGLLRRL